jgi:hypothetical protein
LHYKDSTFFISTLYILSGDLTNLYVNPTSIYLPIIPSHIFSRGMYSNTYILHKFTLKYSIHLCKFAEQPLSRMYLLTFVLSRFLPQSGADSSARCRWLAASVVLCHRPPSFCSRGGCAPQTNPSGPTGKLFRHRRYSCKTKTLVLGPTGGAPPPPPLRLTPWLGRRCRRLPRFAPP